MICFHAPPRFCSKCGRILQYACTPNQMEEDKIESKNHHCMFSQSGSAVGSIVTTRAGGRGLSRSFAGRGRFRSAGRTGGGEPPKYASMNAESGSMSNSDLVHCVRELPESARSRSSCFFTSRTQALVTAAGCTAAPSRWSSAQASSTP